MRRAALVLLGTAVWAGCAVVAGIDDRNVATSSAATTTGTAGTAGTSGAGGESTTSVAGPGGGGASACDAQQCTDKCNSCMGPPFAGELCSNDPMRCQCVLNAAPMNCMAIVDCLFACGSDQDCALIPPGDLGCDEVDHRCKGPCCSMHMGGGCSEHDCEQCVCTNGALACCGPAQTWALTCVSKAQEPICDAACGCP